MRRSHGEQRAGDNPHGEQQQVHQGVKSRGGFHLPRQHEPQAGKRERNQENGPGQHHQFTGRDADARQRREQQEDHALNPPQRRRAQNLAQHHAGARRGRDQHRKQKPFAPVFDNRDGGKDRREHHGEHQRARVELRQVVRPVADKQPEHQRRRHHAHHAALLPPEAHQLALPQRGGRQDEATQFPPPSLS